MRLDRKNKADVRFFIFYLVNGTLDFELIQNTLSENYHESLQNNPELFFQACCVFINNQKRNATDALIYRRCAEFICKTIEPEKFTEFESFQSWEIDFSFKGNDFFDCFKDFAFRVAFEKLDTTFIKPPYYSNFIFRGASYLEQDFCIWANNLELENNIVLNQEYAIKRATQWFDHENYDDEIDFEEWELELEDNFF